MTILLIARRIVRPIVCSDPLAPPSPREGRAQRPRDRMRSKQGQTVEVVMPTDRDQRNRMSHRIPVGTIDELLPGQRKLVFLDGRSIVLFNIEGVIHAIENSCPHQGASLASGQLDGCVLRCPAHGLRFDLRTGRMPGPGGLSVGTFLVQAVDGKLELQIDEPSSAASPAPACKGPTERA